MVQPVRLVSVLTLLLLGGCSLLSPSTDKTLYLDHYREECASFFLTLCNRVKTQPSDPWMTTLNAVEGFEYQWGFVYELRVRETHIANPPADGSSIRTELLSVVNKEKVAPDVRFQLALTTRYRDEPKLVKVGELFGFHNAKTFACSAELCADIETLVGREGRVTLEFTHPQNPDMPLLAQRIVSFEAVQ